MELELNAPQIWLATEPVDFRKAIDGLIEIINSHFGEVLGSNLYLFYNRSRTKIKCLAHHRHGTVLLYKRLEKRRFTITTSSSGLFSLNSKQLSWLLSGLDWEAMSNDDAENYADYF